MNFGESFHSDPELEHGSGDGTVNKRSLLRFREWKNDPNQNGHQIFEKDLINVSHTGIVTDMGSINYILNQLNVAYDFPRNNDYLEHLKTPIIEIF